MSILPQEGVQSELFSGIDVWEQIKGRRKSRRGAPYATSKRLPLHMAKENINVSKLRKRAKKLNGSKGFWLMARKGRIQSTPNPSFLRRRQFQSLAGVQI